MSKQLSISAAFSAFAMAAFVLAATPNTLRDREAVAPAGLAAPALETSLPKF